MFTEGGGGVMFSVCPSVLQRACVCVCVRPSACKYDKMFINRSCGFTKFITLVQLGTKMN